jgi:hypothetical protein
VAAPAPPPFVYAPGSFAATHDFAFVGNARYAACICGTERDMTLLGGKTVRLYRERETDDWTDAVGPCAKSAGKPAAPPAAPHVHDPKGATITFSYGGMIFPPADETIGGASLNATVAAVELSVAFSPVLCLPGEHIPEGIYRFGSNTEHLRVHGREIQVPVEVQLLEGGSYGLCPTDKAGHATQYTPLSPLGPNVIQRMRARYLLQRSAWMRAFDKLLYREWQTVAMLFDIRSLPPVGLR